MIGVRWMLGTWMGGLKNIKPPDLENKEKLNKVRERAGLPVCCPCLFPTGTF